MKKNIITISGPSVAGKSFFVASIVERFPNVTEIVGLTTRPMREGEINGKSGIFMTIDEMNDLEKNNKLVLVKEFFGNKYAWYKDDLINKDDYRIINISYNSIKDLKDMGLNIYSIFIKPEPEETLKELLKKRSKTTEEYEKRINGYYESMNFLQNSSSYFDLIFTNKYDDNSKEELLDDIQKFIKKEDNKKLIFKNE